MNIRLGALGGVAMAFLVGGCAGGAAPGAVAPQAVADEDLPDWVLALPEGEVSRDNDHTGTAALFLAQGAYDQALESAQAGMQFDPTNPQSFLQAAQAYIGLGDLMAADEMFAQVEVLSPRSVLEVNFYRETEWIEGFNAAVAAMQGGDTAGALAAFERAHTIYRGRPEAMVQLGALYQQEGRLDDALALFTEAVDLIEGPVGQREEDPETIATNAENLAASRFNQGQLLFELERYAEASEVYGIIVQEAPDDLMAYSNYGAALVSAGESDRASEVYAELLDRPGLTALDYNSIAVGAYNGDLFLQAADAFGRASQAFPENRDFLFNQTQSLYLQVQALGDRAEELAGGPEAELAEVETELADVASMLVDVATGLVESDSYNRTAYQFLLQGLVRLERQEEAADVADRFTGLPFDIGGFQLTPVEGGYVLPFIVTNRTAAPGATVDLRIQLYDQNRAVAGTQDISIMLEEADVALETQAEFPTDAAVVGYNYEILQAPN